MLGVLDHLRTDFTSRSLTIDYHLPVAEALLSKKLPKYQSFVARIDNLLGIQDDELCERGVEFSPEKDQKCVQADGAYFE
ncbi:hypothetical protein KIN20_005046 [Parelaphostrongylus tenuis]|uniref:Uncharacterized protein n=1 Tax=Parelaphostrongylus tenuis TaxID=148309 RepID=A0AAD5M3Z2_PARTN|nr:hypothetical protein KIN20_005046 [Parelaphostrongylus tenuis]